MPLNRKPKNRTPRTGRAPTFPTSALTPPSWVYDPPSIARTMSVPRVHGALQAAEAGDTRDLFALYRDVVLADAHIQGELAKRKLAVLGDALSILPADKENPDDLAAADLIRDQIAGCPGWIGACSHLLDSVLWPVSVLEKVYAPVPNNTPTLQHSFSLSSLVPVPHHLQCHLDGTLKIFDVDAQGNVLSTRHDPDPSRYIVHRGHLLSARDNWGGPMRSILFWWLLSAMSRDWWARFLDRYGTPFPVGKFRDPEGKSILQSAFSAATRLGGLVISTNTEVELQKISASDSGAAYAAFIAICQAEKSKLIIGQTLSATPSPTGELGGGTAGLQAGVRQDIRKFDAAMLVQTLRDQLWTQLFEINGAAGAVPRGVWGADAVEETDSTVKLVGSLTSANLELTDDGIAVLSERTGLGIQRRAAVPATGPFPFSASPVPRSAFPVPRSVTPLLRSFPAEVSRIIRESASPADCRERLLAFYDAKAPVLADAVAIRRAME